MESIATQNKTLNLPNNRHLEFDRPQVMGILNVTPDSFSDGGRYEDLSHAIDHAQRMIDDGADIIDVGGESTRPGSDPVGTVEELKRVIPVIEKLRMNSGIPISIDTTKAKVADEAVAAGADIVNDVSALRQDPEMIEVVAENKVPIVLMHMLGKPKTMQVSPNYSNCINEITQFFSERIHFCHNYGIHRSRIILDPGIGFGKRLEDNLIIFKRLEQFTRFDCPLMIGASRKSFIQMITKKKDNPDNRVGGSLAAALWSIGHRADILRVHDVAATVEAVAVLKAIEDAR